VEEERKKREKKKRGKGGLSERPLPLVCRPPSHTITLNYLRVVPSYSLQKKRGEEGERGPRAYKTTPDSCSILVAIVVVVRVA